MPQPPDRSAPHEAQARLWRAGERVAKYQAMQGWIDAGERVVLNAVADRVRGQTVLDLGVGAGRTTWLLRLLSDRYTAVDWSPEMVAACRATHPDVDVRQGDARHLPELADGHFAFVFFSYNGIDNLDHSGRLEVFAEVARLLRPGGLFAYSTFSKLGPVYLAAPSLAPRRHPGEPSLRTTVRWLYRLPAEVRRHPARWAAWRRGRRRAEDHGTWAVGPVAPLDYELAHFTTVGAERAALADHGLQVCQVVSDGGEPLDGEGTGCSWFHVIARRTETSPRRPETATGC